MKTHSNARHLSGGSKPNSSPIPTGQFHEALAQAGSTGFSKQAGDALKRFISRLPERVGNHHPFAHVRRDFRCRQ
jgi:hypothetical protein